MEGIISIDLLKSLPTEALYVMKRMAYEGYRLVNELDNMQEWERAIAFMSGNDIVDGETLRDIYSRKELYKKNYTLVRDFTFKKEFGEIILN